MPLDREQHVGEPAEHMGANRLALERARRAAADHALGDRYAKVIRPERDQAFDEADRRRIGLREPDLRVVAKGCLLGWRFRLHRLAGGHRSHGRHFRVARGCRRGGRKENGRHLGGGHRRSREHGQGGGVAPHFLAHFVGVNVLQYLRGRAQLGVFDMRGAGRRQFGEQRLLGIARATAVAGAAAIAESVERKPPIGSREASFRRSSSRAPPPPRYGQGMLTRR